MSDAPTDDELSDASLEVARKAVEDVLIEWRDRRMSELGRGNGFVIRERDGSDSHIIRLSMAAGLRIGIKAYLAALKDGK